MYQDVGVCGRELPGKGIDIPSLAVQKLTVATLEIEIGEIECHSETNSADVHLCS